MTLKVALGIILIPLQVKLAIINRLH